MDFKLIPLLKGLKIGQIVSQLIESHDLTLNPEDPDSIRNTYKSTRTIVSDEYELDDEGSLEIIDEEAEGYQFSRYLDLPKTLTRCLQDTDTRGIKIRHKLKFRVQLLNPDGHISEVCVVSPLRIWGEVEDADNHSYELLSQSPSSFLPTLPSMKTTTWSTRPPRPPGERSTILLSRRLPCMASTSSINSTAKSTPAATGPPDRAVDQALLSVPSAGIYPQRTSRR